MDDQPFFRAVHQEYIQELRHSDDPLLHILANIEEADEILCSIGVGLEAERTFYLGMITALEDYPAECLAVATRDLFKYTAHVCLPNSIRYLHTARHALAYARAQAQSFPTAVSLQDVLHSMIADFRIYDPTAASPISRSRNDGMAISVRAPLAHEAAPPLEEVQGANTASEYLQVLLRSPHPLYQLLATIEESDLVLCATGKQLVEEHSRLQDCATPLDDENRPMAAAFTFLLKPRICERFPILIDSTHTARNILTHVRRQVRAYPALVDRQDVPRSSLADFQFYDPPADVHPHTPRNAGTHD